MEESKGRRRWDTVKMMKCDVAVKHLCFSLLRVVVFWGTVVAEKAICVSTRCIILRLFCTYFFQLFSPDGTNRVLTVSGPVSSYTNSSPLLSKSVWPSTASRIQNLGNTLQNSCSTNIATWVELNCLFFCPPCKGTIFLHQPRRNNSRPGFHCGAELSRASPVN